MFVQRQPLSEPAALPLKAGNRDWVIWQLADSAFPTGGFAHSSGLEAAWQHGELRNRAQLKTFFDASLVQLGRGSLPFVLAAHHDLEKFSEFDELCDCFLSNHVANRASRLQGRALMGSAERIFALDDLKSIREGETAERFFHFAPMFGVVARLLGIERRTVAEVFFFMHLRGLTSSAVRLGIVGPMEAQSLQHQCGANVEKIIEHCERLSVDEVAQTAPLLDLWQGAQDRLYSRLFQS